jgi:hypothetical protein
MTFIFVSFIFVSYLFVCSESALTIDHVNTLTCSKTDHLLLQALMHTDVQKQIAVEWSATHNVDDFVGTQWKQMSNDEIIHDLVLSKYHIQNPTNAAVYTTTLRYKTRINIPAVLRKIIGSQYGFSVEKHIYIVGDIIHSISNIVNIPLIRYATIYTKSKIQDGISVFSKSVVLYADIPWLLRWTESSIKLELMKSIKLNNELVAKHMCIDLLHSENS